jgi:hypothetical protein
VSGRRRYCYIVVTGALVGALTCGRVGRPGLARAGEASRSDSKSDNSSDGSKGSNDSSRTSGDSSKRSGASSEESGHGSKNSTDNSPQNSTRWSTDESTRSKSASAISVAALIVVVAGLAVSATLASRAGSRRQDQQKVQALARFLQRNHALVARDLVTGEGPLLAAWGRALGLTAVERERLGLVLVGSPEQSELLQALDGGMDEGRARRFAVGFTRLGRRALGEGRFRQIALAVDR